MIKIQKTIIFLIIIALLMISVGYFNINKNQKVDSKIVLENLAEKSKDNLYFSKNSNSDVFDLYTTAYSNSILETIGYFLSDKTYRLIKSIEKNDGNIKSLNVIDNPIERLYYITLTLGPKEKLDNESKDLILKYQLADGSFYYPVDKSLKDKNILNEIKLVQTKMAVIVLIKNYKNSINLSLTSNWLQQMIEDPGIRKQPALLGLIIKTMHTINPNQREVDYINKNDYMKFISNFTNNQYPSIYDISDIEGILELESDNMIELTKNEKDLIKQKAFYLLSYKYNDAQTEYQILNE